MISYAQQAGAKKLTKRNHQSAQLFATIQGCFSIGALLNRGTPPGSQYHCLLHHYLSITGSLAIKGAAAALLPAGPNRSKKMHGLSVSQWFQNHKCLPCPEKRLHRVSPSDISRRTGRFNSCSRASSSPRANIVNALSKPLNRMSTVHWNATP